MEKAKELFAKRGYYPVAMSEVAEVCDIAKGTIYLYFDSKSDLFAEIFIDIHGRIISQMRKIIESTDDFIELILRIFNYFEEFIREDDFFRRFGAVQKEIEKSNVPVECFRKIAKSIMEKVESIEEEAVVVLKEYLPDTNLNYSDLYEIVVALMIAIEKSDSKTIKDTALSVLLDGVRKEVK